MKKSLVCSESQSRGEQIKYCSLAPIRWSCSSFLSDVEIVRSGDAGHELDAFWAQFEKRWRLVEPNDVVRRLGPLRARGAKMPNVGAWIGAVLHRDASFWGRETLSLR